MALTPAITIAQTAGTDTAAYPYMLTQAVNMQDITPASVRRTDGDTRFQVLQTEGFYAQSDWSAGFGTREQKDPKSYYTGGMDTTFPGQMICGQAFQDVTVGVAFTPMLFLEHGNSLYGWFLDIGAALYKLYQRTGTTGVGAWTYTGINYVDFPTCGASHRNLMWFGFNGNRLAISTDGATATNQTWHAYALEPFSSMLHYIDWDGTTWRLARWDVDNANTLNVGAFSQPPDFLPGAMRAAYGALYVTFPDTLWSYTTQNGNTGVLTGPLDRWAVTALSGQALEAHDGALVYNAGPVLRRYPPGGAPRTLFPVPPREATNDTDWGEPGALRSVSGRLYVGVVKQRPLTQANPTDVTNFVRILAWNGTGMARVAWQDQVYTVPAYPSAIRIAYDRRTSLFIGVQRSGSQFATGFNTARIVLPVVSGNLVQDAALVGGGVAPVYQFSTLETGRIEFGLADVLKSIRKFRYRVGSGGTVVVRYTVDDATWVALAADVAVYTPTGVYDQAFAGLAVPFNATLTTRWLRLRVELTPGGIGNTTTPALTAITAQPNPALPLRNGFKLSIPVGRLVEDYAGNLLYPDDASVTAALARVKALRADGANLDPATNAPLSLVWVDGLTYVVRANTRVVTRLKHTPNQGNQWVITLDLQEVS